MVFSVDDDGMLLWLSDRSAAALAFAKSYLLHHSAPANRITDPKGHGGAAPADRDVALVVSGVPVTHHAVNGTHVQTTSIAPTILALLGLDPSALQAVRSEHTPVLPGL